MLDNFVLKSKYDSEVLVPKVFVWNVRISLIDKIKLLAKSLWDVYLWLYLVWYCAYFRVILFAGKKNPRTLWLKNSCHLQQYKRKEIMQGKYSSSYFYAVKQICRNATNAAETQGVNKRCLLTGSNPHQYTLTTIKRIMLRWKWCLNEISGLHTVWKFILL